MSICRQPWGSAVALAAALALYGEAVAQQSAATVMGTVTGEGGAPVNGAQILVTHQATGASAGALTGGDGRYSVPGVRAGGPYNVDVHMLGFGRQTVEGVMVEAGVATTLNFQLTSEVIALDAIEVFATRAIERRTPVAYSDVPKVQIQNQLGSRDLPLVLNLTPSVYATAQGGGAGDARVNVRGFSQRNTAVMINGVPVNDMENGWVYWSNWDGLGDASTSIQLQRGLSAVNLATPSIGGTLNVITDPAGQEGGISYKTEFGLGSLDADGSWGTGRNLAKQTIEFNTGESGGFSLSGQVVRKVGEGMMKGFAGGDATWTDAWAYYGALSYQLNPRNRLDFFAVGAPQRHGQNLYKLNAATIDREFATSLEGYDPAALEKFDVEGGRRGSPNVAPVDCDYTGLQYTSTGPGGGQARDRHDCSYINERENYFHKPQVNLNWYSYLGDGLTLSTVGYYSGGAGGGTGTFGSLRWNYDYTQRFPDWDATIQRNIDNGGNGSRGILRNSVNNQWTIGAISKLRKDFEGDVTAEIGIDWRTAEIEHYREVRDLLGGGHYYCPSWCGSDFWSDDEHRRGLGDRIHYNNQNTVDWFGAHVQAERSNRNGSLYAMGGIVQNAYNFEDFFTAGDDGSPLVINSGTLRGFQAKGGAMRNLNLEWSVFGNAGYVSKVPIFDGVIDDVNGRKLDDPANERFLSFEGGLQYRSLSRSVSLDLNLYHTTWRDRTVNRFFADLGGEGIDGTVRIYGLDARHSGIEAQAAYQPTSLVRFDAALSLGNWEYLEDVAAQGIIEGTGESWNYNLYVAGLKVADAPQRQLALSASLYPASGMYLSGVMKAYGAHYANFDATTRDDPSDRAQSWQPPGYTVFDLHWSYRVNDLFRIKYQGDMRFFANMYNVFDALYIQDATDNSRFNGFDYDHDADDAEVYFGYPRNLNVGIQVTF